MSQEPLWLDISEGRSDQGRQATPVCYLNLPAKETSTSSPGPPPSRASCPEVKGQSELMREQEVKGGRRCLEVQLGSDCMGRCDSGNQRI